ncbi:PTS sugar transporter subunit IIA [Companilactobacillus metriopterae]|uniref:PTS sugar transporter subunit IIA n=1 Tax=Companilactobacillus metriopterae TaxID=1909267 RepID=UPI00100B1284|nr:PTS sugar transporter subunit IIA [Companilactobacillus metriopterae]
MTVETTDKLFYSEEVFISNANSQVEVFEEIYKKLYKEDLVTKEFLANLEEREKNYPTGIDMSVVSTQIPNIAIPHTESEFVKTTMVVPVKLKNEITFNNMIDPSKNFKVKFLFMILNDNPEGQSNILARIMDFMSRTSENELITFFKLEDTESIYKFLTRKFAQYAQD